MSHQSFPKLFLQANRLSLSRPLFFILSFFMALPVLGGCFLFQDLSHAVDNDSAFELLLRNEFSASLFLIFVFISLLSIFGKSNLIVFLHRTQKKFSSKDVTGFIFFQNFFHAIPIALFFWTLYVFILTVLGLPLFLFWSHTGEFSLPLLLLTATTFLPIFIILSLLEEFSYFYTLLSRIHPVSALTNSSLLVSRHLLKCIGYSLLIFSSLLIFTFFFNIGMLGIVVLLEKMRFAVGADSLFWALDLGWLVWITIIRQACFLIFFKYIATPPDDFLETKKRILLPETAQEFPPA